MKNSVLDDCPLCPKAPPPSNSKDIIFIVVSLSLILGEGKMSVIPRKWCLHKVHRDSKSQGDSKDTTQGSVNGVFRGSEIPLPPFYLNLTSFLPQLYLFLTSFLPLFNLNLTSASSRISSHGLETTDRRFTDSPKNLFGLILTSKGYIKISGYFK